MLRQLGLLCVLGSCCVGLQFSAHADEEVWFTRYDTNHYGYWDYPEFRSANMDWAARHNVVITEPEIKEQWVTVSKKHHDKVYVDDVRTIREWD